MPMPRKSLQLTGKWNIHGMRTHRNRITEAQDNAPAQIAYLADKEDAAAQAFQMR
jgi:hypothetical protein